MAKKHSQSSISTIAPLRLIESPDTSAFVEKNLSKLQKILSPIIEKKPLESILPHVDWQYQDTTPTTVTLTCISQTANHHDFAQLIPQILLTWLTHVSHFKSISISQLPFTFTKNPSKQYIFYEQIFLIDDFKTWRTFKTNIQAITEEISRVIRRPAIAKEILYTKATHSDQKSTLIYSTLLELSGRSPEKIGHQVLQEMNYFLLTTDEEFRRIRKATHMCRIICACNFFRYKIHSEKMMHLFPERMLHFKLIRTNLKFQFGEKQVLGLVIGISHLHDYELFLEKHIQGAVQQIISETSLVSHSFISYKRPSDSIMCYYVEIEKTNNQNFTAEEIKLLQKKLRAELLLAVEKLTNKLFMPQNEEETLRNILLLSRELRNTRDIPQMIITFESQSENHLRFHIVLLRILKEQNSTPPIEKYFHKLAPQLRFFHISTKVIGFIRQKYPKESNIFLIECEKKPFIRKDHSIDLYSARQFIANTLQNSLGNVRDLNGGMIFQHNALLANTKKLLSETHEREELHLDHLFHAITPTVMRSMIAPEVTKTLFELFITIKKSTLSDVQAAYLFSCHQGSICIIAKTLKASFFQQMHAIVQLFEFGELELAYTNINIEGYTYFGYIVNSYVDNKAEEFLRYFKENFENLLQSKKLEQYLRVSLPRPTSLLDPRIGTDRTSGIVIKMLYEGLIRLDQNSNPTLAVAERFHISPDQKCYTFYLRKTFWSNGKPVTAYDFEYAWKKLLDPLFHTLFAYLFYPIKNARKIKAGYMPIDTLGVKIEDPYTLVVELEHPAPYFLELVSHWIYSPLCKEIDLLHPDWAYYAKDNYVSNGPFCLSHLNKSQFIQAIKNHRYWDADSVSLEKIDISIIENPKTAFELYARNELDWIGEPLSEIPPEIFKKAEYAKDILTHPVAAVHHYAFNCMVAPFQSKKCRIALAIAIDRKKIIQDVLHGSEQEAYSILPPSLSLNNKLQLFNLNKEDARRLFEEGLMEQNIHQKPKYITFYCHDQRIHKEIAECMSKQLKEVLDIELAIEVFTWAEFMEKYIHHDYQMAGTTWFSWFNAPMYVLEQFTSNHEMNTTQWYNEKYTVKIEEAKRSLDSTQRTHLLREAEKIIMNEMPLIPIFYYNFKYMKKPNISNIALSQFGQIDFKWAHIN